MYKYNHHILIVPKYIVCIKIQSTKPKNLNLLTVALILSFLVLRILVVIITISRISVRSVHTTRISALWLRRGWNNMTVLGKGGWSIPECYITATIEAKSSDACHLQQPKTASRHVESDLAN